MAKLTLGYKASAEQFAPRDLLDFGVAAEQNGFDSVVVSDHYQPWNHTDGHAPHSFTWLAALGRADAARVKLGTSVVTPTFRYHPAIIAQTMGTLDQLAPGRVFLGVGTGESLNEVAVLDIKWPGFKERFGRLQGVDRPDAAALDRGSRLLPGRVLPHPRRDGVRQADRHDCRCTSPGPGASAAQAGRPGGRGLHLHQRQGLGALHRDAAAGRQGGRRARPAATTTASRR